MSRHLPINKRVNFCSVEIFELKFKHGSPDNQLSSLIKTNDTLMSSRHTFFFGKGVGEIFGGQNFQFGDRKLVFQVWSPVCAILIRVTSDPALITAQFSLNSLTALYLKKKS